MKYIKFLASGALIASTTFAHAGGMSDEVMEAPVVIVEQEPAPAASSINSTYLIIGVLAALLIAAAVNAND